MIHMMLQDPDLHMFDCLQEERDTHSPGATAAMAMQAVLQEGGSHVLHHCCCAGIFILAGCFQSLHPAILLILLCLMSIQISQMNASNRLPCAEVPSSHDVPDQLPNQQLDSRFAPNAGVYVIYGPVATA